MPRSAGAYTMSFALCGFFILLACHREPEKPTPKSTVAKAQLATNSALPVPAIITKPTTLTIHFFRTDDLHWCGFVDQREKEQEEQGRQTGTAEDNGLIDGTISLRDGIVSEINEYVTTPDYEGATDSTYSFEPGQRVTALHIINTLNDRDTWEASFKVDNGRYEIVSGKRDFLKSALYRTPARLSDFPYAKLVDLVTRKSLKACL